MEFKEIVMKRYAAKKFDGRPIPESKVKELLLPYLLLPFGLSLSELLILLNECRNYSKLKLLFLLSQQFHQER